MGLAVSCAGAWQFYFVLPPRILTDVLMQPLLASMQRLRSLTRMPRSLAQS
jgi:hypothetical protein